MNNQKITGREMKYVIALFFIGSSLVAGASVKAGQDSWISIIIGAALLIPMIFIYSAILNLYPGENLFDIIVHIFGSILGKIICFIYILYALHLGSLVINIFAEFIHAVNMPETPKAVITGFLIFACVFMIYNGISTMGSVSKFLFPLLLISVVLTIITATRIMDINNLKPVLNTDLGALLKSSYTVFTLPFGECILFTTIFSCVDPKENYKRTFFNGLLLGAVILIIANLRNLLILGPVTVKLFPYPSYEAISIIAVGEFFTRIEVIIGANLLLAGFIKVVVCCFSACQGFAKVFNINEYKYIAAPTVLIMLTLSSFAFKNTVDMLEFVESYQFYVIPYQILLPLIILITGKIKNKVKKQKTNNYNAEYTEDA